MSELQGLKKAELSAVCRRVGIHVLTKDTKKALLDKLTKFIEQNPDEGLAAIQNTLDADSDADTVAEDVEENSVEEEEEDEDEDEDEGEDQDSKDEDYKEGPPIDLREWVVDPLIEKFEIVYSKVLGVTDRIGVTVLEYNDELRENLSTTITLNYIELIAEFAFFLYTYVPVTSLEDNSSIPSWVKEQSEFLSFATYPLIDLIALLNLQVGYIFLNWLFTAVIFPLLSSYYINFSRQFIFTDDEDDEGIVRRIYEFDPFIFALTKVVIYYFIVKNGGYLMVDSYMGIAHALKYHFLSQLGIYHKFTQVLGNFPLIIGLANSFIALYSQFEDY